MYPFESAQNLDETSFKTRKESRLNQNIDFGDSDWSQMSMSHDAWACDATSIYNYNDARGLVRASMDKQGKWERVTRTNRTILGLKSVSLVCVDGRLLMRHSGLVE